MHGMIFAAVNRRSVGVGCRSQSYADLHQSRAHHDDDTTLPFAPPAVCTKKISDCVRRRPRPAIDLKPTPHSISHAMRASSYSTKIRTSSCDDEDEKGTSAARSVIPPGHTRSYDLCQPSHKGELVGSINNPAEKEVALTAARAALAVNATSLLV